MRETHPADALHSRPPSGPGRRLRRAGLLAGAVALAVLAGAGAGALALYGMKGPLGNASAVAPAPVAAAGAEDAAGCAGAVATAAAIAPLVKGEIAAFTPATQPKRLPPLPFADAEGRPTSLAALGRPLALVNLWATWCAPCRKEMPALDRLQGELGGPGFEVVAINLDARNPEKPPAFLKEIGVTKLRYFADAPGKSFQALRSVGRGFGLPTTLLVDGEGCEIGFLAGPADWGGPEALALIRAAQAQAARSTAGSAN